jgi:hypothetical protein
MTTATAHAPATRKAATTKKVDITKLSDKELMALDEKTYLASLSPWVRKLELMARPLRGKLTKAIEQK